MKCEAILTMPYQEIMDSTHKDSSEWRW